MTSMWTVLTSSARSDAALHLPLERRSVPIRQILADAEVAAADLGGARRAGVLMANGEPWIRGMAACFRAGAAMVPLALPVAFGGADVFLSHVRRIADDCAMEVLLVDSSCRKLLPQLQAALPSVRLVDLTDPPPPGTTVSGTTGPAVPPPGGQDGDLAVIQYTSGSTSAPKGVALTNANVVAGLRSLAEGAGWTTQDVMGIWIPLFHDMGLFTILSALACGSSVCVWRPSDFVRDTKGWLASCAASPATVIPMPNFAFDYLVEAVRDGIPDGLDLSGWRLVYNGAEPVQMRTIEAFAATFASHGFRPEAMWPSYGLAEATLVVSWPRMGELPRSVVVDRRRLDPGERVAIRGRQLTQDGNASWRHVVSVGRAVPGLRIRIADPAADPTTGSAPLLAEAETVGEVQLRGPAVMSGYLGVSERDQPFTADGWLCTGDLGFMSGGDLFLIGRRKDVVIIRGQNYYAEDVEEIVRRVPGIDRRHCAAVGVSDADGARAEHIAVLIETSFDGAAAAALVAEVEAAVAAHLGMGVVAVHPVRPRTIPYTSSGKVRRRAARELYDKEILGGQMRGWQMPDEADADAAAGAGAGGTGR